MYVTVSLHVFVDGCSPRVMLTGLRMLCGKNKTKQKSSPEDFSVGYRAQNNQILLQTLR